MLLGYWDSGGGGDAEIRIVAAAARPIDLGKVLAGDGEVGVPGGNALGFVGAQKLLAVP